MDNKWSTFKEDSTIYYLIIKFIECLYDYLPLYYFILINIKICISFLLDRFTLSAKKNLKRKKITDEILINT